MLQHYSTTVRQREKANFKCGVRPVGRMLASSEKFGMDFSGFAVLRAKSFIEPHALAGKKTGIEETSKILLMRLEGMSNPSCERLTGIHRGTILGLMIQTGESCRRFMEKAITNVVVNTVECDEQWAFIGMKRKTAERLGRDTAVVGDRYVFTAIDRDPKLLICWHAGQRSASDTWTFADKLKASVAGSPTINTDGFNSYTFIIPCTFQNNCNYAQIIKHFQSTGSGAAAVRYSPGSITSVERRVICGSVPEYEIGTSRMERFNLTTRMQVRRFTRLTNAHSKKTRNHDAMLGLYFAWYNFCRNHSTIKTTPAVEAGIATDKWSMERLLTVAAAA